MASNVQGISPYRPIDNKLYNAGKAFTICSAITVVVTALALTVLFPPAAIAGTMVGVKSAAAGLGLKLGIPALSPKIIAAALVGLTVLFSASANVCFYATRRIDPRQVAQAQKNRAANAERPAREAETRATQAETRATEAETRATEAAGKFKAAESQERLLRDTIEGLKTALEKQTGEVTVLQRQLKNANAERVAELEKELASLKSGGVLAKTQTELSNAQHAQREAKAELSSLEARTKNEIAGLKSQLQDFERVKTELERVKSKQTSDQAALRTAEDAKTKLEAELSSAGNQLSNVNQEIEQLKRNDKAPALRSAQDQITRLEAEVRQLKTDLESANSRVSEFESSNRKLTIDLRKSQDDLARLQPTAKASAPAPHQNPTTPTRLQSQE